MVTSVVGLLMASNYYYYICALMVYCKFAIVLVLTKKGPRQFTAAFPSYLHSSTTGLFLSISEVTIVK